MALPSNVDYGTVVGQFLLAYADSNDVDLFPDGVPAKGSVFFDPSPVKLLDASSSPNPVTIMPATVECQLDSEGYILGYTGERGVRLVATDDADLNPQNWTWTVTFRLTDQNDVPVQIADFSFQLPAGTTVDLTTVSPVPDASGTFYLVGPEGPQGPQGPTGPQGNAATLDVGTTNTGAEGTDAAVTNSGTTSAAIFDFTIPRGDTGATGPQGPQGIPGEAATVTAGTTTTGAEGTNASVVNSGTSSDAVFDFTIPKGDTGATGPQGDAATIAVGTVSTVAPDQPATVTNTGTSGDAVFDFEIPQGETGDVGNISATAPITYNSSTATIGFDETQIGEIDGGTA